MKTKPVLIILFITVFTLPALSQWNNSGGFGYFIGGVNFSFNSKLQDRLQSPTLLGSNFKFSNPGLLFGGRGMGVFGRFIMGGAGYGGSVMGSTDSAEATISSGGGFFNAGYILGRSSKNMLYLYGGFGGGGSTLKINNTGTTPIQFATNQQVPVGENRKIEGGGFGFEFGIGFNQLVIGSADGSGGFMVGVVAGAYFFPSSKWEFEANNTNVANLGRVGGAYIGLTIGGGNF